MDGAALRWFQGMQNTNPFSTWTTFVRFLEVHFGSHHRSPLPLVSPSLPNFFDAETKNSVASLETQPSQIPLHTAAIPTPSSSIPSDSSSPLVKSRQESANLQNNHAKQDLQILGITKFGKASFPTTSVRLHGQPPPMGHWFKHLTFVGDSMARNELESLLCLPTASSPVLVYRSSDVNKSLRWPCSSWFYQQLKEPVSDLQHLKLQEDNMRQVTASMAVSSASFEILATVNIWTERKATIDKTTERFGLLIYQRPTVESIEDDALPWPEREKGFVFVRLLSLSQLIPPWPPPPEIVPQQRSGVPINHLSVEVF